MIAKADLIKKILTSITLGLVAALSIMLALGVSPVQGDQVTGRAVIGTITRVVGDTVTVSTAQGEFTLKLDAGTRISAPRTRNASVVDLAASEGRRVAILADRKLVNEDGTHAVQVNAVRISIIPSKATREHRRVVVTEKRNKGEGTAVDAEGNSTDLLGVEGSSNDTVGPQLGLPEPGESAVLLVRPGFGEDQKDEVTVVIKSQAVVERLIRLAEKLKMQNEDVFKSSRIEGLLERHRDAVKKRLENTRAKAEERHKEVIGRATERAAKALRIIRESRGLVSGLDEEKSECVRRILGRMPASKADIPPGQLRQIEVRCLQDKDAAPNVKLTLPQPGTTLTEGEEIEVRFETGRLGEVVIQLLINREVQTLDTVTGNTPGLRFRVPVGEPIMSIELRGSRPGGDEGTIQKVLFDVRRDPPPRLRITTVGIGRGVAPGSVITLGAIAEDNGQVVSIKLAVNGVALDSATGTSLLGGVEYSVPAGVLSLEVEASATDNLGNTTTVTRTVRVASDTPPSVKIVSPGDGSSVEEGSTLKVEIEATDDGRITGVDINWPISGETASAKPNGDIWVAETTVPTMSSATVAQPNTSYPPHVFVGQVTIGGVIAPAGTVVTAWTDGSSTSRITLEAIATDDGGNASITSISLELLGQQVQVGEGTVAGDGTYTLIVSALQGQNFTGKTIRFRVGGVAISSTGAWEQGGGTEFALRR